MEFNDLLRAKAIAPERTILLRHTVRDRLRQELPRIAREDPALFNAYQRAQDNPRPAQAMKRLAGQGFVASFLGHVPGRALFVGLYAIQDAEDLRVADYLAMPGIRRLKDLGMVGPAGSLATIAWFDLQPLGELSELAGRLVVAWPGRELAWWRRAENNHLEVLSISEESLLGEV